MASIARRMWGAAILDAETYEEIEHDAAATRQAFLVVLVASAAAGVGSLANLGVAGVAWHSVHGLLLWYAWAWVTWWVGTRLLPTPGSECDRGELLRTIGFASTPGLLRALALVLPLGWLVFGVAHVWMLAAMVVAVREALDTPSTWRAAAVCAVGFPIFAIGMAVSLLLLGPWPT